MSFTANDLSSPEQFGLSLLAKGNAVCQAKFQKSVQSVLTETPRLTLQPNHRTRLLKKRKVLQDIKNTLERDMNVDSDMVVL